MTIKNKIVLITGASSGIGEATAKLLAKHGAKLVLGARRAGKLQTIVDSIQQDGGEAVYRVTDVTQPADLTALVATAQEAFGEPDVIFNNAGIMPTSPISALKRLNGMT